VKGEAAVLSVRAQRCQSHYFYITPCTMCYAFSTYSTYKYNEVHNKRIQSKPGNARLQSYGTCVLMQIAYSLVYKWNGDHSTGRQHEQSTCSRTASLSTSMGVHSYPSTSFLFHL